MSVIQKASLVLIPSGYKEDVLYSQVPNTSAGDFTFTRASTGTRVNSDGYVEEVPWNIVEHSEELDDSYWTDDNTLTITENDSTSPIGNATANKLVVNSGSSNAYVYRFEPTIGEKSLSVYGKKGAKNWLMLACLGAAKRVFFDLDNGVIGTNVGSLGASISDEGNGWYRCSITFTYTSGNSGVYFYITDNDNTFTVTGNDSDELYLWGAMVNKGDTPKTYIKTTDRLDIPRLDYSGGASCPTLLLEAQRTNKSYNSEDWTATGYIKNNCTATANQAISPDNTQTADQLDFGNGTADLYENVTTITAASTYSVFVKYIDYQYIQIIGTGDVDHYANFDIQNGIVGNTGSESTASIEDYGNGWYRCIINYNSGTFAGGARLYKTTSLTAGWASGGGDAGSFYFWGNQMELGTYHTSYIPTSGTSVTRVGDVCIDAGDATIFNSSEGVLFAEVSLLSPATSSMIISLSDGGSNRLYFEFFTSNRLYAIIENGSSSFNTVQTITQTNNNKIAFKYSASGCKLYINGTGYSFGGLNFSSGTLGTLNFATSYGTSSEFYGKCKQLITFNEALTDSELIELTGGTATTYNWIDNDSNEIITSDGDNLIFT